MVGILAAQCVVSECSEERREERERKKGGRPGYVLSLNSSALTITTSVCS